MSESGRYECDRVSGTKVARRYMSIESLAKARVVVIDGAADDEKPKGVMNELEEAS
jgi:hypothetical protein